MLALWRALRRPLGDPDVTDNSLGRTVYVFDTLATAKAQTVLRYWNWSFTADAVGHRAASTFDDRELELSLARRNAALLFTPQRLDSRLRCNLANPCRQRLSLGRRAPAARGGAFMLHAAAMLAGSVRCFGCC